MKFNIITLELYTCPLILYRARGFRCDNGTKKWIQNTIVSYDL